MERLFIDSSLLIAACGNQAGGSAAVLELIRKQSHRGFISPEVIAEARLNIKAKMAEEALVNLYKYLAAVPFIVIEPTARLAEVVTTTFPQKDWHIVSAALAARATALITLDKKNFFNPRVAGLSLPFRILTPKMWLLPLKK